MALDERKLDVLRAIVEDYVATQEPVGSKALVERHNLSVSPATVRNDMAVLEEEGYIRQPHTSAGRIPTDRGYRLFVDKLSRVKPLSPAERRAIERFLVGAVDLDDVVHRTVRLLAQLTRQVAVVQYPSLARSNVRHCELVPMSTTRLMIVMIADTGRVEQRFVELPAADGRRRRHRAAPPGQREAGRPAAHRHAAAGRGAGRRGADAAAPADDGAVDGAAGDAGRAHRGADRARRHRQPGPRPARLPGHAAPDPRGARGRGHPAEAVRRDRAEHDPGPHRRRERDRRPAGHLGGQHRLRSGPIVVGGMGVLGPTRMDYPGNIATVRAVARYVGDLLAQS